MSLLLIFALFLCTIHSNHSARILAYVPSSSYSHQIPFRPLWKELSLRGHQVTFLTAVPINDATLTNLTEINLNFTAPLAFEIFSKVKESNLLKAIKLVYDGYSTNIDHQLQHHEVQKLLHGDEKFDLVIAEYLTLIPFAFAEKFKCPSIAVTSLEPTDIGYEIFGVPTHPIAYPTFVMPFSKTETLFQRIISVTFNFFFKLFTELYDYKQQDAIVRKHFGKNFPTVLELSEKISLLLENVEPILSKIRPRVPATIPVGGILHVPAKPLPKELQKVLDSSSNGFIYFSFGSVIRSDHLSNDLLKVVMDTFAELPYTVLCKFKPGTFSNVPKNVFLANWVPQADVLKHPNIKLFITHGGRQSSEEAVFAKVPILGIPQTFDQPKNIRTMVEQGFGLSLDYKTLNKHEFKEAIMEVTTNPSYRNAISRMSDLIQDQPMSGLDRAVWWVEYVIRHKGAGHLRSPVLDIPFYQYYLIDVIAVFIATFLIIITGLVLMSRAMYKIFKFFFKKSIPVKLKKQ
ncbi:hypothetical protein FQR65_LT12181 [Abscondita terminalis]|nr:hypothetical protein FQR65_LT12181 [Abscondita terminalis]